GLHSLFRWTARPLNRCSDGRPSVGKELLPFRLEQKISRAGFDKPAEPAPGLDQLLAGQLLISLENGEGIEPIFGGNTADRRQRIAFVEHAVENHSDDTIP